MSFISADGFRLKVRIISSAVHCHCLCVQVTFFLRPILTTAKRLKYAGVHLFVQGGSNMTGTDLCVNKPHCAEAVRP